MDEAPTLMNLLRRSTDYLSQRGIENARREAEWLFVDQLRITRLDLYTRFDMLLEGHEVDALRQVITRRGRREPLAYILGTQPFCGLELLVDQRVLVPRSETEQLVELAMAELSDRAPSSRVIDVGTGSGAIALGLASELKQAARSCDLWAVDLSADALEVARANAEKCELDCQFAISDLLESAPGPWHLIVTNLPYIGEEERHRCDPELDFEPSLALYSGADGLDHYRRFVAQVASQLSEDGCAWCEHGDLQASAMAAIASEAGLQSRSAADFNDKERFTRLWR